MQGHELTKKGRTDDAPRDVALVPLGQIIALIGRMADIRPFLAKGGHTEAEVGRTHAARVNALALSVALWSRAHVDDEVW